MPHVSSPLLGLGKLSKSWLEYNMLGIKAIKLLAKMSVMWWEHDIWGVWSPIVDGKLYMLISFWISCLILDRKMTCLVLSTFIPVNMRIGVRCPLFNGHFFCWVLFPIVVGYLCFIINWAGFPILDRNMTC